MKDLSLRPRDEFDAILERYADMVYRLAFARVKNPHDAADVVQEVFLKYVQTAKTKGEEFEQDEEYRKAWLIRTAINTTKTFFMTAWNRHRSSDELSDTAGSLDPELSAVETKSVVCGAVMDLPQKYRTVVHLFYYEDMSVEQIARVAGLTVNTVKSHLFRARNLLKETLKGVDFNA